MHRLKKLLLVSGASIGLLAPSEGKEFNERVVPVVQEYTQGLEENSSVIFEGNEEDKRNLKKICVALSKTEEGKKTFQELKDVYKETGKKVSIGLKKEGPLSLAGGYNGEGAISINAVASEKEQLGILSHELKHHIQRYRPKNSPNTHFSNLKDVFISDKLKEVEAFVSNIALFDEIKYDTFGLSFFYRRLKEEGMRKFSNDPKKATTYAKTEIFKTFWENKNILSKDGSIDKKATERIKEWNDGRDSYNDQAARKIIRGENFFAPNSDEATLLFKQNLEKMGVDLTPDYLREKLYTGNISLSDNKMEFDGNAYTLKKNENAGLTFSERTMLQNRHLFGLIKTEKEITLKEQVFGKDGSCLCAKEGYPLSVKEGNIKLNLDETNYRIIRDEKGQYVRRIHEVRSTNGLIKKYYPNEKIFEILNKEGDLLQHFSPTGKPLPLLKDFENGKDGVYTKYEQDFSRLDVNYKGGKKNGPCRIYDAEGKILSEVSYYNDQLAQENHQKST